MRCEYCEGAKPLAIGKTNDIGIAVRWPDELIAYGYDIHGSGSNGLIAQIKFCPMCGRKLEYVHSELKLQFDHDANSINALLADLRHELPNRNDASLAKAVVCISKLEDQVLYLNKCIEERGER